MAQIKRTPGAPPSPFVLGCIPYFYLVCIIFSGLFYLLLVSTLLLWGIPYFVLFIISHLRLRLIVTKQLFYCYPLYLRAYQILCFIQEYLAAGSGVVPQTFFDVSRNHDVFVPTLG